MQCHFQSCGAHAPPQLPPFRLPAGVHIATGRMCRSFSHFVLLLSGASSAHACSLSSGFQQVLTLQGRPLHVLGWLLAGECAEARNGLDFGGVPDLIRMLCVLFVCTTASTLLQLLGEPVLLLICLQLCSLSKGLASVAALEGRLLSVLVMQRFSGCWDSLLDLLPSTLLCSLGKMLVMCCAECSSVLRCASLCV